MSLEYKQKNFRAVSIVTNSRKMLNQDSRCSYTFDLTKVDLSGNHLVLTSSGNIRFNIKQDKESSTDSVIYKDVILSNNFSTSLDLTNKIRSKLKSAYIADLEICSKDGGIYCEAKYDFDIVITVMSK